MAELEGTVEATDEKVFEVEPDKQEIEIKVKKTSIIIPKLIFLFFGIGITVFNYLQFAHCSDCNNIVVIYLSIIGLCCFMQFGLPVHKLMNKDTVDNFK